MIFMVFALSLLSICRGDVSHLDTDLREDGYHYKQPYKPFPPGKNDIDDQLGPSISQKPGPPSQSENITPSRPGFRPQPENIVPQRPGQPQQPESVRPSRPVPRLQPGNVVPPRSEPRPQQTNIVPPRPTAEYLPPDNGQFTPQSPSLPKLPTQPTISAKEYGPPSTFLPQTPAEPKKEYGSPTTFIPQTPPSAYPQRPSGKPQEEYGPLPTISSQTRRPQPSPIPQQPKLPATPDREYLPPGDNEISTEQKPKDVYPTVEQTVSPKFPAQQPKLPTQPKSVSKLPVAPTDSYPTPKPKYPGSEPSIRGPQATYPAPESTYPAPRPTNPLPQASPAYESGPETTGPIYEEDVPGHELGPDGYKYKVPSNKFQY